MALALVLVAVFGLGVRAKIMTLDSCLSLFHILISMLFKVFSSGCYQLKMNCNSLP